MTEIPLEEYLGGAVVVGVDSSSASWAAIRAAAWEAQCRGRDLVLVHGYYESLPYAAYGWSPYVPSFDDIDLYAGVRAVLGEYAGRIRELYPDLPVHTQLRAGGASGVLVQLSDVANLVVVGSRGDGGFGGLSIGSTAAQTAAHATAPVLVIRPRTATGLDAADAEVPLPGPVVVGVAGSPHDEPALPFAFEEASLRGVPVVGVHVWWYPPEVSIAPIGISTYDNDAQAEQATRVVAEALAGWADKYPDVSVEQRTIQALNTSYALIEESAAAGLVVVGCRGRGGFTGLLLGSVSRDLVGHAHAPVAVIHDHA